MAMWSAACGGEVARGRRGVRARGVASAVAGREDVANF